MTDDTSSKSETAADWIAFEKESGETISGRIRARREGYSVVFDYEIGNVEGTVGRSHLDSYPQLDSRVINWGYERAITDTEHSEGVVLPEDVDDQLKTDEKHFREQITVDREEHHENMLAEPLILAIINLEYETGWRTHYQHEAKVLEPSKQKKHWTEDEQTTMAALKRAVGETQGYVEAEGKYNPFHACELGTTFDVDEAVHHAEDAGAGVEDAREAIAAETERKAAREALIEDHPELHGVTFDPDEIESGFEEAAETGESVTVARGGSNCNDQSLECSWDNIAYRATPDGEITRERIHTY